MADHTITLSPEDEAIFQARVDYLNTLAAMDPPAFPPVLPVADVDALLEGYMTPICLSLQAWYATR